MHFGLKVAWFSLSAVGLLSSYIVLYAFGRATGIRWGPGLYSVGNTLMQGTFCLGMIYKMDPYLMPRSFCIAQTLLMSLGDFITCGVTLAFSIATYTTVLKPKTWGDGKRLLKWKNKYLAPIVLFPLCAITLQTIFVAKFDSVHATEDMHCDSSHPEWVRFLGYGGVPFFVLAPALYLSIKSCVTVRKTHQHLLRARPESSTDFTSLPRRSRKRNMTLAKWAGFAPPARPKRVSCSPTSVKSMPSPTSTTRKFDFPSASAVYGEDTIVDPTSTLDPQEPDFDDASSNVSVTFPTFAHPTPDMTASAEEDLGRPATSETQVNKEKELDDPSPDSYSQYRRDWFNDGTVELKSISDSTKDDYVMDEGETYSVRPCGLPAVAKSRRPIPILEPAVMRIILFQIAFITVQILASISTIIDIATRRSSPMPLGTQHFALLLSGWGPVVVFGPLPSVRRNLKLWRPAV